MGLVLKLEIELGLGLWLKENVREGNVQGKSHA